MDLSQIASTFAEHGVAYLLVGRSAAWLHGLETGPPSSLDICYHQQWENCECLNRALEDLDAAPIPPPPVPIPLLEKLRRARQEIHLRAPAGHIALVPEVPGMGNFDELRFGAEQILHTDIEVPVLSWNQLERWLELACQSGDTSLLYLLLTLQKLKGGRN